MRRVPPEALQTHGGSRGLDWYWAVQFLYCHGQTPRAKPTSRVVATAVSCCRLDGGGVAQMLAARAEGMHAACQHPGWSFKGGI